MIDFSQVRACIENLVGFRSSASDCVGALESDLISPDFPLYINDVPGQAPAIWQDACSTDYENVSAYLRAVRLSETMATVQDFVQRHKDLTRARHLVDNIEVAKTVTPFSWTVNRQGSFRAIELVPNESTTIIGWIRMIGLQLKGPQSLKMYLFESSQLDAIATWTLNYTGNGQLQWFTPELIDPSGNPCVVRYSGMQYGTAQRYFLGYFENDLLNDALNTELICGSCGVNMGYTNMIRNGWLQVYGANWNLPDLNGIQMPDINRVGRSDTTCGIHLKISVTCDLSDLICQNKTIFAYAAQLRIAKRLFWDFYNSDRVNGTTIRASDRSMANATRTDEEYKTAIKAIDMDFTNLDKICAPCSRKAIRTVTGR